MRTLHEIARSFDTDKDQSPGYLQNYERHFNNIRNKPIRLLELGVYRGGSLLMWKEFFSKGLIVGLDIATNPFEVTPERICFYQGSQDDEVLLDRIARECAPDGFDIIIDDAAHIGTLSKASFRILFRKYLKKGGIYVIEDWGTGYWDSWQDGACYLTAIEQFESKQKEANSFRSRLARWLGLNRPLTDTPIFDPNFSVHNFGMVGFVKELVDIVAWEDITHPERGNNSLPQRKKIIKELIVNFGQVFVMRA